MILNGDSFNHYDLLTQPKIHTGDTPNNSNFYQIEWYAADLKQESLSTAVWVQWKNKNLLDLMVELAMINYILF